MAKNRINNAGEAVAAVRDNAYVQKALNDEQLHDEVRSAIESAKSLFEQMQSKGAASNKLTSDDLYDDLQAFATSVRDATDSIRSAKSAPKSGGGGGGLGRLIGLAVIGGIAALVLSESLRGKVLDALFGAEEEFQYTPSSAVNGTAPAASSTNGASADKPAAKTKAKAKPESAE